MTFAFALRRNFPWNRVAGYWMAQFVGAVAAGLTLKAMFSSSLSKGLTVPQHGDWTSTAIETILTLLLVTVILATAANFQIVGHNAALAVAGTIILCGLLAVPLTGASMNPARSLGVAVAAWDFNTQWV